MLEAEVLEAEVLDPKEPIDGAGQFLEKIIDPKDIESGSKCTFSIVSGKNSKNGKQKLVNCIPIDASGAKKSSQFVDRIELYTKAKGPATSTKLLNNFNIDDTLERFSKLGPEMFGKKFYHVGFQMIDFLECGGELAEVQLTDLIERGYDCMGVVLNTDVSSGGGKHWFCIYCDFKPDGHPPKTITMEHFNSSGRAARQSVSIWSANQADALRAKGFNVVEIKNADKVVQESNTECGMWSIIYILWRLLGYTRKEFYDNKPEDDEMIKLRKLIFNE